MVVVMVMMGVNVELGIIVCGGDAPVDVTVRVRRLEEKM
jgi:hypothetical protein